MFCKTSWLVLIFWLLMKNVLFVSNLFPRPEALQRGVFNASMVNALHARLQSQGGNVEVWVPVPQWRIDRWRAIRRWTLPAAADVKAVVRYIPYFHVPLLGRSLASFFLSKALDAMSPAVPPDAMIASWLYPDAVSSWQWATRRKIPCWIRLHGTDRFHLDHRWRGALCRKALQEAQGVMVNATFMKEELVDRKVPESHIRVIRNGIMHERFHAPSTPRESGLVLWVGNMVSIKQPELALKTWKTLLQNQTMKNNATDGCRMVMIGEGPLRHDMERLSKRWQMTESLSFTGSLDHDNVAAWMQRAQTLLLTSRSEGMPNVVLEALSCGMRVVATPVGDIPAVIRSGENGWLVDQASTVPLEMQLAEALRLACTQPYESTGVPEEADSWDQTAAQIQSCLDACKGREPT